MTKAPECPLCRSRMQRTYIQATDPNHRRIFAPVGWLCSNPGCNFFSSD